MKLRKKIGLALVGLVAVLPSVSAYAANGRIVLRFSSPNFAKSVVYDEEKTDVVTEESTLPSFPNYEVEKPNKEVIIQKKEAESEQPIKPLTKRIKGESYSPILSFDAPIIKTEPEKPEIIIDSDLSWEEAIKDAPENMPREILADLRLISVQYIGFDGNLRQGQILIHKEVQDEVLGFFDLAIQLEFPIYSVIPISQFGWDDDASMFANNTHSFDWRNATTFDWIDHFHGHGHAIDVNPRVNPYYKGDLMLPANGTYDKSAPGTLFIGHPIIDYFDNLGWAWGGYWHSPLDLHHFQKDLPEEEGIE